MKSSKFIILFIFVFNIVFSQEKTTTSIATDSAKTVKDSTLSKVNFNKWSIEIGTGISNGTRPYTDGYFTSINNKLFNGFILNCYSVGGRYNYSKFVGLKMDIAFDHFINNTKNKSKPFEVAQYRTSVQGVLNLTSLAKPKKDISRINLLFRAGFQFARLIPIAADYNKKVSKGDNYSGIVLGLTPIVRISKKTSVFLDFSSFSNYGQNLTWNGKHSEGSANSVGHMYASTFGLSFALDKKH
jgi:OOP family OmpA-OmpF porin